MTNVAEYRVLPDAAQLEQAVKAVILDSNGQSIEFGTLFSTKPTVVVFIRHFFCGDYVTQLSTVRQDALARAGKQIVIVGCGSYEPILNYAEITGCPFPIYADPSRSLYRALGMTIESLALKPADEPPKSYVRRGVVALTLSSIWRGPVKNPLLIGKQGNISQLGGEFVFEPGPKCTYASRMQHTQDHVEVADLMKASGIEYP